MAAPIDKEKRKKQNMKIYIICGVIFYVFAICMFFQYEALHFENRRASFGDLFPQAMLNVVIHPTYAFPLHVENLGTFFGLSIAAVALFIMTVMNNALRAHDNPDTVNGEAHLMNEHELLEYNKRFAAPLGEKGIDGPENMIFAKDIRLAIDNRGTRRNANVVVIGGSGAGKSRFMAGPNILQANCNYIITDPSGELLNDYGKYLENLGYEVMVFNLTDVYKSSHYNAFDYIKEEKDVFTLVEALIKNTNPGGKSGGDPFWENSEKLLIIALMLYQMHVCPKDKQTFSQLVRFVSMANVDEDTGESPLDSLFEELRVKDPENLAVQQYDKFKLGAGKTLKSILISVGVRLKAFDLQNIKYLTRSDDFDLYTLGDTKKAIFVVIPTADTTFNFLVAMFYSQIFSTLYDYCETKARYGYRITNGKDTLKIFHATDKTTQEAKAKANEYLKDIRNGVTIKYDKNKELYVAVTKKKHQVITWRGTKEDLIKEINDFKNYKVEPARRRCEYHIRFIMDEFANIGQIPDFSQKLATMRKYEISCTIILQAFSQLEKLYKEEYEDIIGNCDSSVFLGSTDMKTIKFVVDKLGKRTTTVQNTSWNSDNKGGSTSYNKSAIELLTVDQIQMMDDSECLVLIRGVRPYYGKKFDLVKHPGYELSQKTAGTFFIPAPEEDTQANVWLSQRTNENKKPVKKEEHPAEPVKPSKDELAKYKVETNLEVDEKKRNNIARKEEAEEAKKALDRLDKQEIESDEANEGFAMDLMDILNVSTGAPADTIKERLETVIKLEKLDTDELSFQHTNTA